MPSVPSVQEGGTRVAGFVSSPLLPAAVRGTVNHGNFHVTDWLPTIVGLAGASVARNRALDGHDIWTSLSTGGESPRTEMLSVPPPPPPPPSPDPPPNLVAFHLLRLHPG